MCIRKITRYFKLALNMSQILPSKHLIINKKFSSLAVSSTKEDLSRVISFLIPMVNKFQLRHFPKNKDRVRNVDKKVEIREDLMAEFINVENMKQEMDRVLQKMKDQYIQNVSLRSSLGSIEAIPVQFEGEEYIIRDLAQVNRKNPKVIALNLAAFPQTIPFVIDAIKDSGMNLNPQQDGTSIYVPIPKVTREHRENLKKNANSLFLKCKTDIRAVQFKFIEKLEFKQNDGLSLEQFLILRDQITALANVYISKAEKMKNDKTKELSVEE